MRHFGTPCNASMANLSVPFPLWIILYGIICQIRVLPPQPLEMITPQAIAGFLFCFVACKNSHGPQATTQHFPGRFQTLSQDSSEGTKRPAKQTLNRRPHRRAAEPGRTIPISRGLSDFCSDLGIPKGFVICEQTSLHGGRALSAHRARGADWL